MLNSLLSDGRASARDIAAETSIAATTVSRRLDQLVESGVIEQFTPRVDYGRLGYDVTAVFQLSVEGSGIVTEELAQMSAMIAVYEVTGDHDIVAVGKFQSTAEMNERIKMLLTDENIRSVATSVVLDVVLEFEQFPIAADDH